MGYRIVGLTFPERGVVAETQRTGSDGADLASLTNDELRSMLAERGVVAPSSAVKAELVALLEGLA